MVNFDYMDFERLNGPPMTQGQIDEYLHRIGLSGPISLDLAGLTRLHQAHQRSVPFENLDVLAGRPISLEREALFEKIVRRKRGGLCSELNTLYNWLLISLGFQVVSYNARITGYGKLEFRRHRVLGVSLNGTQYTTDVGSTLEYARIPLLLMGNIIQEDGFCEYMYKEDPFLGWVQHQRCPGEDWKSLYGFSLEPNIDLDYVTPTFYYEHHPDSVMVQAPRVSIYTGSGIVAIRRHCYYEEANGQERLCRPLEDWEEEKRLLRELFHLPTEGIG